MLNPDSPYNFNGRIVGFLKKNNFAKGILLPIAGIILWAIIGLAAVAIDGSISQSILGAYRIFGFVIIFGTFLIFLIRSLVKDRLGFKIASGVFLAWATYVVIRIYFIR